MRLPFESQKGCCRICGRHVEGFEGEYLCDRCAADPPWFEKAAGALRFEEDARRMVIDFKFNNHLWLRDDFTDWLEAAVSARLDVSAVDAVIPMPATVVHRLLRGYNQCDALAKNLARRIGRKYLANAVRRCGRVVRPGAVRGRTLLVVDDVLTTGSTLSECALALKADGAERVWCVTLAKSVID